MANGDAGADVTVIDGVRPVGSKSAGHDQPPSTFTPAFADSAPEERF